MEVKAVFVPRDPSEPNGFVCGSYYRATSTVVLCTQTDTNILEGVVVANQLGGNPHEEPINFVGEYSKNWNTEVFQPFYGQIVTKVNP